MNTRGNRTPTVLTATGVMQKTMQNGVQHPDLNESTSNNSQKAVLQT
jgi:hypothetical protein